MTHAPSFEWGNFLLTIEIVQLKLDCLLIEYVSKGFLRAPHLLSPKCLSYGGGHPETAISKTNLSIVEYGRSGIWRVNTPFSPTENILIICVFRLLWGFKMDKKASTSFFTRSDVPKSCAKYQLSRFPSNQVRYARNLWDFDKVRNREFCVFDIFAPSLKITYFQFTTM